ncbi:hypothetical protein D3C71_2229880 [compost metagenome]
MVDVQLQHAQRTTVADGAAQFALAQHHQRTPVVGTGKKVTGGRLVMPHADIDQMHQQ